jgi:hypothetical protein
MRRFVTAVTEIIDHTSHGEHTRWRVAMFPMTIGNTQVYSPFGTYVVEQHDARWPKRYVEDLPRPDLKLGKDHPLEESVDEERRAA